MGGLGGQWYQVPLARAFAMISTRVYQESAVPSGTACTKYHVPCHYHSMVSRRLGGMRMPVSEFQFALPDYVQVGSAIVRMGTVEARRLPRS